MEATTPIGDTEVRIMSHDMGISDSCDVGGRK